MQQAGKAGHVMLQGIIILNLFYGCFALKRQFLYLDLLFQNKTFLAATVLDLTYLLSYCAWNNQIHISNPQIKKMEGNKCRKQQFCFSLMCFNLSIS